MGNQMQPEFLFNGETYLKLSALLFDSFFLTLAWFGSYKNG